MRQLAWLALLGGCGRISFDHRTDAVADTSTTACIAEVTDLAVGRNFTCVLRAGTVTCWGGNDQAQLGAEGPGLDGIDVPLPAPAVAVDAGTLHACAVLEDRRVFCWGWNATGQLGNGMMTAANLPPVQALVGPADAIVTGSFHSCARRIDGVVECWGQNSRNQLGDGLATNRGMPRPISTGPLRGLVAGHAFTCGIDSGSGVMCWGYNGNGALGTNSTTQIAIPVAVQNLTGVTELAAGGRFACARRSDGSESCWGGNDSGQLGTGDYSIALTPIAIPAAGTTRLIGAGTRHSCVADETDVRCVGGNNRGQLGDTTLDSRENYGAPVTGISGRVRRISASYDHSCALTPDGVYCWGNNADGQLGTRARAISITPVAVQGVMGTTELLASDYFACAQGNTPAARCWGAIPLAAGTSTPVSSPLVGTRFAAGFHHACAIQSGGTVACYGLGFAGQLGNGQNGASTTPVTVSGIANVTRLAGSIFSTCALDVNTVVCWGANNAGQLGDGTQTDRNTPQSVIGSMADVAMGGNTTCALAAGTGLVSCWGNNERGQIGNGTAGGMVLMPKQVDTSTGLPAANAIDVGGSHACALAAGNVWCWGENTSGELGNGTGIAASRPVQVSNLSNVTQLSTGASHSCAVRSDQSVWCWGAGTYGQLGDGMTVNRHTPVRANIAPATTVAAGSGYTCALLVGGTVQCWGLATLGQLGDGHPVAGATAQRASTVCAP